MHASNSASTAAFVARRSQNEFSSTVACGVPKPSNSAVSRQRAHWLVKTRALRTSACRRNPSELLKIAADEFPEKRI